MPTSAPLPSADVELPFGVPFSALFCPACGAQILGVEEHEPCAHVLYVFLSDVGYPTYVAPDLETELPDPEEDEDAEFLEQVERILTARGAKPALALSVTSGGMACGPVWLTVYVGFDFGGESE